MTKFSPNQQIQTVKSTPSLDNKQPQYHSRLQLLQEQAHEAHGSIQQRLPSSHQRATNTTKQTSIRGTSAENGIVEQPSLTDDDDDYDDDDVEIIMYDSSSGDTLSNESSLGPSGTTYPISSVTDTTPQQQQRHDSSSPSQSPLESKSQLLQRQLEYYFSRQNLINDTYLVSQMDPDLFVPIAIIAKFKRVMNITMDMDFIISTLKHSSVVILNDSNTMVKPNISIQRTTVILRDVPESTDKEIKQFLAELKSPPVKDLKEEYANMWYVTFDSEEDALKMLHDSRGKLFKGQPVAARMKFEPLVGSIQAQKSALKTGSALSTPSNNITTSANPGQNQHTTTNYNKYYSGYNGHHYHYNNAHMNFESQQPLYYANQSGKDYSHHYANDNQRSGRFIHYNTNHHSAKSSKKSYRHNNYYNNGNIKNSAWRSRHYYWQSKPHRQPMRTIYRADHTVTSNLNKSDLSGIDSAVPLPVYSLSASSYQHATFPSGKNTHYCKKSPNCYHDQSDEKPTTRVLSSPQYPSFIQTRIEDDPAPTTSMHQYQGWQKDDDSATTTTTTTTRHSTSSETKNGLSASSSRRSSVTTKVAAELISSYSSNSETASTATTTTNISPIRSPSIATTISLETQEAEKQQQKIKWNKKKNRNTRPRLLDSTKERSYSVKQQQPDIQSRVYFPPLPISSNVSQGAASSVTSVTAVTDEQQQQLQQQVSVAEIVKKGATTAVAMNYGSSNSSTHAQKTDNKAITTGDDDVSVVAMEQQQNQSEDDDPFPRLCPMHVITRPPTSLSYADMLMKNNKDIDIVVV